MKRCGMILLMCALLCVCARALGEEPSSLYQAVMFYNPGGGQYTHLDINCNSENLICLPQIPVPEELLVRMSPCPYCAGSTPIFSAGGDGNLSSLWFEVYLTSLSHQQWLDESVYRIHIVDQNNPSFAFKDLLFPSIEGGDGLALLLRIVDMNFDGYPDVGALRVMGASNIFSTYFLYSPVDGQYHYEPVFDELSAYALYPEGRMISNYVHDSAATGIRELYRVLEDGRPILFRRVSVLRDEQSNWEKIQIKATEYDLEGAQTVLMDEIRDLFTSDEDYLTSERKWLEMLYEGVPEEVLKMERGE